MVPKGLKQPVDQESFVGPHQGIPGGHTADKDEKINTDFYNMIDQYYTVQYSKPLTQLSL